MGTMNNTYVTEDMYNNCHDFKTAMDRVFPGMYEREPLQPTLCLVEEAGEFAGAMRRWMGLARRNGTRIDAMQELADVVISAHVAAHVYGFDLEDAIARKWEVIMSRGFKDAGTV
jgi:NTP pyrophosphatase (non-canonical NTP hydrolase)